MLVLDLCMLTVSLMWAAVRGSENLMMIVTKIQSGANSKANHWIIAEAEPAALSEAGWVKVLIFLSFSPRISNLLPHGCGGYLVQIIWEGGVRNAASWALRALEQCLNSTDCTFPEQASPSTIQHQWANRWKTPLEGFLHSYLPSSLPKAWREIPA